jgi:hypothetical protein
MALDGKKVSQPTRPEHALFAAPICADVCWPIVRVLAVNVLEKTAEWNQAWLNRLVWKMTNSYISGSMFW